MQHEATFRMLDHVIHAHRDDRFGELSYVAGHLIVVHGFVAAALKHAAGWEWVKQYALIVECAALGHDLKEDHPDYWTQMHERLLEQFGEATLRMIEECTDDQNVKRRIRKERQIDRITVQNERRYSTGALLCKMGDWYGHLMPWGKESMVPSAIQHARLAVQAARIRIKSRRNKEQSIEAAARALSIAASDAKKRIS